MDLTCFGTEYEGWCESTVKQGRRRLRFIEFATDIDPEFIKWPKNLFQKRNQPVVRFDFFAMANLVEYQTVFIGRLKSLKANSQYEMLIVDDPATYLYQKIIEAKGKFILT